MVDWKQSSTWKFFLYSFICFMLIVTAVTAVYLHLSYKRENAHLESNLRLINETYVPFLVSSLWVTDYESVQKQINGMVLFNYIDIIEVKNNENEIWRAGARANPLLDVVSWDLIYSFRGEKRTIGSISLFINKEQMHADVRRDVLVVFSMQLVLALMLAGAIAGTFYFVIGKHLLNFARFLEEDDPKTVFRPFIPDRFARKDELQLLVEHFNGMRYRIGRYVVEIEKWHDLMGYIIRHDPNAIAVHNKDLRYVYVSDRYLSGYRIKDTDIIGKHIYEVFPETPKEWREAHKQAIAGKAIRVEEHSWIQADGTVDYTQGACRPWYGTDGSIGGIVIYTEFITERKKSELALKESEKKFRHLFEKAEEGILIARGEILEFANPALERILGHSMSTIISEPFVTFIHPDDQASVLDRHLKRMQGEHLGRSYDFRVVTAESEVKWVNINNQIIDWEGSPANLGFVADITLRKQAELEQARLMSAIEQSSDVIVITDTEGTIQYVNPAFLKVTGYTREEAIGQNPCILKSGNQDDSFYQNLWATITRGDTFRERMVNKRKDGSLYTEYATISPVVDAKGRIVNFVAVKRDITEREKLQSQLNQAQKMESVGRLAGGVAHDFNNKLAIINGYAEMALDIIEASDPLYETIQEIHTAGQQSASIVRQLLAFARQQTISPVQLDLNDTISGMLKMLQRLIGENIDLTWHPGKNLWPVKIDPSQVDQIMANLTVNARDAISDIGELTIRTKNVVVNEDHCRLYPYFIPGKYVVLSVSDTGCGMDKEVQEHLFDPFFTTKGIGKGTGLGLSTIYGIVKQNSGFINVYSEPGEGSVFTIYFPAHEAEKLYMSPSKESKGKIPMGSETILLVEDEPVILKMGREMIERLGYKVLTAENPNDALQTALEYDGNVDLLITDVIMPDMNGRDLSSRLVKSHPHVKTLYMSGYTANVIAHHGVLDERVQFIQKPFSLKELATKVREVLEQG